MTLVWFVIAVVFFILWLTKESGKQTRASTHDYAQGYWDGYRAFGEKVRQLLGRDDDIRADLKRYIDEGYGVIGSSTTQSPAPVPAEAVSEEPSQAAIPAAAPAAASASMGQSVYVSGAQVAYGSQPQLTEHELAAAKEQTMLRNMNIMLYFASFLLVAAATAFIAAAMPPLTRLIGLIAVVVLFYGSGIMLYKKVARLKPAGVAFVGTGLAILPFIGVALHMLGGVPEATAWLIISVVGLVAYYAAAMILNSQVVSYLTMAFLLSLVSACVATATLPMVWYFIGLIGVSLAASSVSVLAPKALPAIFTQPVEKTGQIVTPVTLLASLVVPHQLGVSGYEIVFGVATAHYLVAWLQTKTMTYETVVRVLAQLTLSIAAWDLANGERELFGSLIVVLSALQAVYSLVRVRTSKQSRSAEAGWLIVLLVLMQLFQASWILTPHAALLSTLSYLVMTLLGVGAVLRFKNAHWGYVGLVVSLPLVFTVTRSLITPAVSWEVITVIFAVLAMAAMGLLWYARQHWRGGRIELLAAVSSVSYLVVTAAVSLASTQALTIGESFLFLTAAFIVLSYIIAMAEIEIVSVVTLVVAVTALLTKTSLADSVWFATTVVVLSGALTAAAATAYHLLGQRRRRTVLFGSTLVLFSGLLLAGIFNEAVVRQTSVALLVAASLGLLGLRVALRFRPSGARSMVSTAYITYIVLAWLLGLTLGLWWLALVYAAAIVVFWLTSFIGRQAWLMAIGNIAVLAATFCVWRSLELPSDWIIFGVGWIGAAIVYATYWLLVERRDTSRQNVQLITVWVVLFIVAAIQSFVSGTALQVAWALNLLLGAGTMGVYGYMRQRRGVMEAAIYLATFGLQRLVDIAIPEVNLVAYAHWWALVVALVAWWRATPSGRTARLVIAVSFITFGTAGFALDEGGWYQLLFLVEELILLVVGALRSLRWLLWWGLIASSLAVLYFLKDYTYLWLGFLGILLIGIVVWRLLRHAESPEKRP